MAVLVVILICGGFVNPFNADPATCGHFDQNRVALLLVIVMCG